MFGYGMATGVVIGLALGAALFRYALGLGEKMAWGVKDGSPALSEYARPLLQSHTDGTQDEETEG